jgi:hypothetical protein
MVVVAAVAYHVDNSSSARAVGSPRATVAHFMIEHLNRG